MTATTDSILTEIAGRGLVIGGDRVTQASGGVLEHRYAATGEVQAEVALAGIAELDQAVAAATDASAAWRNTPADERGRLLMVLADILARETQNLARLETLECGRPISETINDAYMITSWTRYYAGYTDKMAGSVVAAATGMPGLDYVLYEPYGVIGAITPFNIPLSALGMKVVPAIAAGNTVVVKPSDKTPFSALRFAELAIEAGIPAGVVNVITGAAEVGDAMVRHPAIHKISFTGGLIAAQHIMRSAAEVVKPLHFELGGKSANIIFPDANLEVAIPFSIVMGAIALAGQGCVLPTRLFVHEDIYDQVTAQAVGLVGAMPMGDPLEQSTMVGPVINEDSANRIVGVIDQAKSDGASLLAGGARAGGDLAKGYYINPTLFGDVDNDSSLAQNEVFGPVLSILRFSEEDEVVAKANSTNLGLFSYLFTNDLSRAHRMARSLESGQVNINGIAVPPGAPFGGVKQSGFGSEGGEWGLKEFLRPKNVYIAG